MSLVFIPVFPQVSALPSLHRVLKPALPPLPSRKTQLQKFLLNRERSKLFLQIEKEQKLLNASAIPAQTHAVVAAFYGTWQETGLHSLRANADKLTHIIPEWLHLSSDGAHIEFYDWNPENTPHNKDVVSIARKHHIFVMPILNNAAQGKFDPARAHLLLSKPELQAPLMRRLKTWLLENHFYGVNVDFENMYTADYPLLTKFLRALQKELSPSGLQVSTDIEADNENLDWKETASPCDFVVLMAYDEHATGEQAGPIASIGWYRKILERARRQIPADKLVIGIGNYAYDWTEGNPPADDMTYQEALFTGQDNRPEDKPSEIVDFDPLSMNPTFNYEDEKGRLHEVWMLDAATAANQWMLAQRYNVRGAAVWVIGFEDPTIWTFLRRDALYKPVSMGKLRSINFPYDVEFLDEGEILSVKAKPRHGKRRLEKDTATGLITDETYAYFPQTYVIRRTGLERKSIALTIDDGPADPYTGEILDVLKASHVSATFFVIGENAERYPDLVKRMWKEGHEIGNHTFTHPNMGDVSDGRAKLELNATQRALQSTLGHSTILFRPPYNADAEPTSAEEVKPIVLASELGYYTVGEYIDPQDWNLQMALPGGKTKLRTAKDIAQDVIAQVHTGHGNTVLLHDGGGDRTQTVEALPLIISSLQKEGYHFVTVSHLMKLTRGSVMPPVRAKDMFLLGGDRMMFETIFFTDSLLRVVFLSAIALGTFRVLLMTFLALFAYRRGKRRAFDMAYHPPVSVLIAAYNEQKIIERMLHAVIDNGYEPLEIVVVDDGSTDGTADVVQHFAEEHKQVHLIRQQNLGKAAAMNNAVHHSTGDILICIDADTLFAKDTVAKLVRHFSDRNVGAVAGNVKVGNPDNMLTIWQAIEYITSQNLDRRAYALLNAVTVIPGAVGAWRREAMLQVGGYEPDTLAEDTDLTWRVRRAGWRMNVDMEAVGYTEAPDSLKTLFRQRFRWAFGTLQCLWKHRGALGRYGAFGRLMLPSLWIFQIAFQILSPIIDLQVAWILMNVGATWFTRGIFRRDWQPLAQNLTTLYQIGFMYAFFFVMDLMGAALAFLLDRERMRYLWLLFWQRFAYRQLMYAVMLKSLSTALQGIRAGWGKQERKGTVKPAAR